VLGIVMYIIDVFKLLTLCKKLEKHNNNNIVLDPLFGGDFFRTK